MAFIMTAMSVRKPKTKGYPPHLQHLAPTDADLDMVLEEVTGRPADKGSARHNAIALRQRIAELLESKGKLLTHQSEGKDVANALAAVEADLAKARKFLAGYATQLEQLN